ncbi:MAG: type II toxin-antitoxin system VapC family toxin [Dehalococcoidia bacterium]
MPSIIDASGLVAWADRIDSAHDAVVKTLRSQRPPFHVPAMALAEACHLIGSRRGRSAEVVFIRAISGLPVHAPTREDLRRMGELMQDYLDWPLGAADASIVALAERLDIETVITLDRRHFVPMRPAHRPTFKVVP